MWTIVRTSKSCYHCSLRMFAFHFISSWIWVSLGYDLVYGCGYLGSGWVLHNQYHLLGDNTWYLSCSLIWKSKPNGEVIWVQIVQINGCWRWWQTANDAALDISPSANFVTWLSSTTPLLVHQSLVHHHFCQGIKVVIKNCTKSVTFFRNFCLP